MLALIANGFRHEGDEGSIAFLVQMDFIDEARIGYGIESCRGIDGMGIVRETGSLEALEEIAKALGRVLSTVGGSFCERFLVILEVGAQVNVGWRNM